MLKGKRIVLGVTGGIAAYKAAELVRELVRAGAEVYVVMTKGAQAFVTPLTFQTLSGQQGDDRTLQPDRGIGDRPHRPGGPGRCPGHRAGHSQYHREDRFGYRRRYADDDRHGHAGSGPAGPGHECSHVGEPHLPGKYPETSVPAATISSTPKPENWPAGTKGRGAWLKSRPLWKRSEPFSLPRTSRGRRSLVTAGPTEEPIDPVRFISNRSSGKMGFSLARAAVRRGAEVVLISGPTALPFPPSVKGILVRTASRDAGGGPGQPEEVFHSCHGGGRLRLPAQGNSAEKIKKSSREPGSPPGTQPRYPFGSG